jgi:polyhydroxybutyrate depolymerase
VKARIKFRGLGWLVLGAGVAGAFGCGDGGDDGLKDASGGQAGRSPRAGTGGTTGGTGTAGSSATGGTTSTGGSSSGATGGTTTAGAGGSAMSGGNAGSTNTGGKSGTGGTSTAGSAGTPAAGTGGSGGATPSTGCTATDWPMAGTQQLTVEGTEREFIVAIPEEYDSSQPYRLAFAFHGRTGTAEQIAGGFGGGYYGMLSRLGDSTILVSPQGLGTESDPEDTGWPNTNGRDITFVRAMIDWLSESYCIDQSRIFSTGFSYGGIMSNAIGCQMPDVFRGIAPMAGAMFFGRGGDCEDPPGIATWMVHGSADETVTFEQGETARDVFLAKNGCDTATEPVPVEPEGCVAYQGCEPATPLIWCVHDGAHVIPSFAQDGISEFFAGFD